MNEAKAIYGSYNKAAHALGVPWSTVASITSGRARMPAALAALIALQMGRDPLEAVASVEMETATPWQVKTWRKLLTSAPGPAGGHNQSTEPHITRTFPNRRWSRGRGKGVSGMRGGSGARSHTWGRICWMLRPHYQITSATGWR